MADNPDINLKFIPNCPDCGVRKVSLPESLPQTGNDFDWQQRDYDSYRLFMLEELIARFPERKRWTPADMEVVLVEVAAAGLDQLSDMLDRTASEAFLETARRPESVRRLLKFIGYDAVLQAGYKDDDDTVEHRRSALEKLEQEWLDNPQLMARARQAGVAAIHNQKRMVTLTDYTESLQLHPLVQLAFAWNQWSGSWNSIQIAVVGWHNLSLDQTLDDISFDGMDQDETSRLQKRINDIKAAVDRFHLTRELTRYDWDVDQPVLRTLLQAYLGRYRLLGQEVVLQDARRVGISMALSLQISDNYFQSEIRNAVQQILGTSEGGYFAPGNLSFGQDVYASDIVQVLMSIEGVQTICLNRFKRVGKRYLDQSDYGRIVLTGLEVAVCENSPARPEQGYFTVKVNGGRKG